MAVKDLIASVLGGTPVERLQIRGISKRGELDKIDKDLAKLDQDRRKLWARQDLDGADVTKELDALGKKQAALLEQRDRKLASLEELTERERQAESELERKEFVAAVAEIRDRNLDVEQLEAEYRKAAADFFTAASRCAAHNARLDELHRTIARYTDHHSVGDDEVVRPVRCEQPHVLPWGEWKTHNQLPPLEIVLKVASPIIAKQLVKLPAADASALLGELGEHYRA